MISCCQESESVKTGSIHSLNEEKAGKVKFQVTQVFSSFQGRKNQVRNHLILPSNSSSYFSLLSCDSFSSICSLTLKYSWSHNANYMYFMTVDNMIEYCFFSLLKVSNIISNLKITSLVKYF